MSTSGGQWHVALFGGPRVERGATAVRRFPGPKIAALFSYLALYLHRDHPREELADRFWPDATADAGRASLRAALTALRRLFEEDGDAVLTAGRLNVGLNPDAVTVDVYAFERSLALAARPGTPAAERARFLAEAADLYRGPLLPGISEPWAATERERFAGAYRQALRDLVGLHEAAGDYDAALEYARRWVAADPAREEAHADVIRLLGASGQSAAARRQFDALAEQLKPKGTAPSEATRALLTAAPAPTPKIGEAAVPATGGPAPAQVRLPAPLSRFFGREDETAALAGLLTGEGAARLVTVTGPGGGGKTRLAVETARRAAPAFPGGVTFVPLADLREASRIGEAVASALGLPPSPNPDTTPLQQVADALRETGAPALLVLDNFEQLVEEGADLLQWLLSAAPNVSCLVTSRQRLLVDGEREFPLLPLPTPDDADTLERLTGYPSVQLFVNRAQAARPDFQLTARNAAAVARLCRALEGIPLAIEIAASWCHALSPAQMLERITQSQEGTARFDLLVARRRDVSTRHATLRATIRWSYDLLPADVQRLFVRLAVFRGGWTLDAAEQVCADADAVLHLTTLRDHSLVIAQEEETTSGDGSDETRLRFRILETLREFADETLPEGERADLARRHAAFFAALAERADAEFTAGRQGAAAALLEADHENLRAAFDLYLADDDPAGVLRLGRDLWRFWMVRGYLTEGRRRLAAALERAEQAGNAAPAVLHAAALNGAGALARLQSDNAAARPLLERAITLLRGLDPPEPKRLAGSLQNLAIVLEDGGDYEGALVLCEESLALRRAAGDDDGVANALNTLGTIASNRGDPDGARAYFEESLAVRRALGQPPRPALLINIAGLAWDTGDRDGARRLFEEAVAAARAAGQRQALATGLAGLGVVVTDTDPDAAGAHFAEAARLLLEVGDLASLADALEGTARLASVRGRHADAARLWGAAEAYREQTGIPVPPGERAAYDAHVTAGRTAAGGGATFDDAWAEGRGLTPAAAVAVAAAIQ